MLTTILIDFYCNLCEFYVAISACFFLLYCSFLSTFCLDNFKTISISKWVSEVLFLMIFFSLLLLCNTTFIDTSYFFDTWYVNYFTLYIKVIIFIIICGFLYVSNPYVKEKGFYNFEFYYIALLGFFGIIFIINSNDFLILYLAIELQSLAFYVIAAYIRKSSYSTESGLKYFITGAVSSGLYLFGTSFVYGSTGSTNFGVIQNLFNIDFIINNIMLVFGFFLLFVSIGIKLSVAPFHIWSVDVYEGSPSISTFYFIVIPKLSYIVILIKFLYSIFLFSNYLWIEILLISSIFCFIVSSFGAFYQRKIKRFIVFSSIGHMGFMLSGLACLSYEGFSSTLFYLIVYSITSFIFWQILLLIINKNKGVLFIDELVFYSKNNSLLSFFIVILLFSMSGIPPLVGFEAKLFVLNALVQEELYLICFLSIFYSAVSCFYYLRIIKVIYFEETRKEQNFFYINTLNVSKKTSIIISSCILFILFIFFDPSLFYLLISRASLCVLFLCSGSSVG